MDTTSWEKGPSLPPLPHPPSSKRSHHQHRFRSIDWWPTARKMWTSMDVEHSRGGVHKGGHLRPTERDKNATRQRRAGVGVDRSRASAGPVGRPTAEASCSAQHLVWWPQARQPVPAHPPGPTRTRLKAPGEFRSSAHAQVPSQAAATAGVTGASQGCAHSHGSALAEGGVSRAVKGRHTRPALAGRTCFLIPKYFEY